MTAEQVSETGQVQSTRAPLVRHTAPKGAISAAVATGVPYLTDCGVWRRARVAPRGIRRLADLAPNTCPLCALVITERTASRT